LDLGMRCYQKKPTRCLEYHYYLCVVFLFLVLNPEHGCEQILGCWHGEIPMTRRQLSSPWGRPCLL
jgi:hypothetical protein